MIYSFMFIDKDCVQQTVTSLGTVNDLEVAPCVTWILPVAVGQGQRVRRVDLGCVAEAGGALLAMVMAVLDGHLAELSGEAGRALTLVPGTALSSIDARKMADH